MKREISAGGIITVSRGSTWYVLLIKDMKGEWTFPKGKIEENEKPADAAKREIAEEVGLHHLTLVAPLTKTQYFYKRNGLIHKYVYYFLFQADKMQRPKPLKEEGISAARWVPFLRAFDIIGYAKTGKPLLTKAKKLLWS
jgi:8-oxo-dGTP pyrophosphatase MutT (NUDIX family)